MPRAADIDRSGTASPGLPEARAPTGGRGAQTDRSGKCGLHAAAPQAAGTRTRKTSANTAT